MDAVKNDVKRLVKVELAAANRKHRMFASAHEGVAGCVSYYDPMNRSDQPKPTIELKEVQTCKRKKCQ